MPELTESDLKAYQTKLSRSTLSSAVNLNELKDLYSKFELNEQNLINLKYSLDRIRIENNYTEEKQKYQASFSNLKKQYKQVDNRITSVEQKLSRGIPDDMELIEKLIAEQEAIVQEQEKLNAAESALSAYKSTMDISYGKTREKLEQNRISQNAPLKSKFDNYILKLGQTDKKIKTKTSLCTLVAIIGIPLFTEFVAAKLGIPIIASKTTLHIAAVHYLFLAALILTEFFLAERIEMRSTLFLRFALPGYIPQNF